jgi:hypothetical protein
MALVYVGGVSGGGTSATYTVSLNGTLTGGIASSPAQNDIVVVITGFVGVADGNPGVVTSGYAELADLYANDTRDANLSVAWKLMGASPDTQVEVNGSGSADYGSGTVVHVWRGVNTSTPFDETAVTATAINSATADAPAIVPVTSKAAVLSCALATGGTSQTTLTAPSGMGNLVAYKGDGTLADVTVAVASYTWTLGTGTYNPGAFGGAVSTTSDSWATVTLVLRPLDSTGPLAVTESSTDSADIVGYGPLFGTASIQEASDQFYLLALTARSLFDSGIYDSGIFDVNGAFGTGSLVAVDSPDIVTAPGHVFISGSVAAQATDVDQFSGQALALARGALSTTEQYPPDGFAATGLLPVTGSAAAVEMPVEDEIAVAAVVYVTGSLGTTDAEDILAVSGGEALGVVDAYEASDVPSISGSVYIAGTHASVEANDVFVLSADVVVSAIASVVESDGDAVEVVGAVLAPSKYLYYVIYPAALAEPSDAQIKSGLDVLGNPAVVSGYELAPTQTSTFTFSYPATGLTPETAYRISFVCFEAAKVSNVATSDVFTTTPYQQRMAALESPDICAISGSVPILGDATLVESPDIAYISSVAVLAGQLAAVEAPTPDSISASGRLPVRATDADIAETADGFSVSAKVPVRGSATPTEARDQANWSMLAYVKGTANLAEISVDDAARVVGRNPVHVTANIVEPAKDTMYAGRLPPGPAFVLLVPATEWQMTVQPDVFDVDVVPDYVLQQTMPVNATSRILEVR